MTLSWAFAGLHFGQAQTKEKAESNQEREDSRMGDEEEGKKDKKRKRCAS